MPISLVGIKTKTHNFNIMRKLIFYLLLFLNVNLQAQVNTNSNLPDKIIYNASYFGNNIWNPGLKLGAEYIWKEKVNEKTKHKKNGDRQKINKHQLLIDGYMGVYWDPMSHVGAFASCGLKYTKTHTKGFEYHIGLNPLGYYRSFLPETYEVSNNWEVKKVTLPGRSYYAPSFTIGLGKLRKNKLLSAWFLSINSMLLVPYNTGFVPLINFEYGYKFNLHKNEK